ncbi:hypothetical protein Neosp_015171 [[Neocosmospora] mangrovei]
MKIQHLRRIHSFVSFGGSLSRSGASPLKSLFIGADAASKVAAEQEDGDRELQGDATLLSMSVSLLPAKIAGLDHRLESEYVPPDTLDRAQWEWMKSYSTWASNQKVFLYPENLIEPNLGVNESPFFKDPETELAQNELTKETVNSVIKSYTTKLADVSNLEPVSLYLQKVRRPNRRSSLVWPHPERPL